MCKYKHQPSIHINIDKSPHIILGPKLNYDKMNDYESKNKNIVNLFN